MTAEPMAARHTQAPTGKIRRARRHRAELRAAMQGFECALAASPADPAWRHGVAAELARLRNEFRTHVELTEGPDGLYAEVLWDAPRLVHQVYSLGREHEIVCEALDAFAARMDAPPERLRRWAGDLLRELSRHRQRGADLVYEAYATDIGGEN
jgi:hypothetical protein